VRVTTANGCSEAASTEASRPVPAEPDMWNGSRAHLIGDSYVQVKMALTHVACTLVGGDHVARTNRRKVGATEPHSGQDQCRLT
jgi:hypothetical protein